MKSILERLPIHSFVAGTFPILALLANNFSEVETDVVIRPLLVSVGITSVLLLLSFLWLRDANIASLLVSFLLVLFFSYGHLYRFLETVKLFNVNLGRHRFLIPAYGLILATGLWFIFRKYNGTRGLIRPLNLTALILFVFPITQLSFYSIRDFVAQQGIKSLDSSRVTLSVALEDPLPDIYYIVLDSYTRADALNQDFQYDNTPFLDDLEALGFYIADCSRTNYSYTLGAMTSALNYDYLPSLMDVLDDLGMSESGIWVLMKQSLVRRHLESIGYKTVAYSTGYDWSQLTDADIYISVRKGPFSRAHLQPFEFILIRTTAMLIVMDTQIISNQVEYAEFVYGEHIATQRFILDSLQHVDTIPSPKFVFVHILIPHVPFVFGPDGEIHSDLGYYGANKAQPINDEYLRSGYVGQVQFINNEMLRILTKFIETSTTPPIIVMHGDHGWIGDNRLKILNAYYMPGLAEDVLYPSISPVNSFRVVFDNYFGTDLGLLPDESFEADSEMQTPETSPDCFPG